MTTNKKQTTCCNTVLAVVSGTYAVVGTEFPYESPKRAQKFRETHVKFSTDSTYPKNEEERKF